VPTLSIVVVDSRPTQLECAGCIFLLEISRRPLLDINPSRSRSHGQKPIGLKKSMPPHLYCDFSMAEF
jgi:hypothetical protein